MHMASAGVIAPSVGVLLVSLLALRCGAKDVAVEGTVVCQACNMRGTWDLEESRPIGGAEVRVECKDANGNRTFIDSFFTDFNGYFYASLKGVEDLDTTGVRCKARLRSSSESECDQLTNVGAGFNGAPVRFLKHLHQAVLYTVGPFAFLPSSCAGDSGFGRFRKGFGNGEFGKGIGNGEFGEGFGDFFGNNGNQSPYGGGHF